MVCPAALSCGLCDLDVPADVYGASVASPEPVLPSYGAACIDRVAAALLAPPGRRPGWIPGPALEASQLVFLLLDGLGWTQLRDRLSLTPTLSRLAGGTLSEIEVSAVAGVSPSSPGANF